MVKRNLPETRDEAPPSRRAIQAEQTRTEIVGAARRLFASQGYAATSVKDIAREAGVSVQTLYDSVGSKADLVRRLNDLIDSEARVFEIAMTLPTETDPAVVARVPARITRRIVERCSDILRTGLEAARAEPDLAFVIEEGGRRHRAGSRAVAERLEVLGALDPTRSAVEAATAIAALADFRLALILIDDHALDFDAVEQWIADMTMRAVLDRGVIDP
jgi:AcrR family transcriptional regulator